MTTNSVSSRWRAAGLALRSLFWAILFPGVVSGYLPWQFFGLGDVQIERLTAPILLGSIGMVVGVLLLAACIVEFARRGRGTLSPVDPPNQLVVQGLYRYVRNPMYLSVSVILLGEVAVTRSPALGLYWAIWFLIVNLFVIGYEEPDLRRRFGSSYEEYLRRVNRWVPTLSSRYVRS